MPLTQLSFLILLTLFIIFPLISLWLKYHRILKQFKKTIFLTTLCATIFGGIWQHIAIKNGVWAYSGEGTTGLWLIGVPLEEHLFNILVGSFIAHVTLVLKYRKNV